MFMFSAGSEQWFYTGCTILLLYAAIVFKVFSDAAFTEPIANNATLKIGHSKNDRLINFYRSFLQTDDMVCSLEDYSLFVFI